MLQIKITVLGALPGKVIWFAPKPRFWDCLNCCYKQSTYTGKAPGYSRQAFFTKVIDLSAPVGDFEAKFDQKTLYEIRRAVKDGVATDTEADLNHFINFYNLFAQTKNLPKLSSNFTNYQSDIVITKAIYSNHDIVMHAYLKDENLKRVRLMHSASLFRNENQTQMKAIAGRANRLLHYKDMCHFKDLGYQTYDLGGYAPNTTDESLSKINQFKDSFGGTLTQESDYLPVSASVFSLLNKWIKLKLTGTLLGRFKKNFLHDKWNIGYLYQTPEDLIRSQKFTDTITWLKEDGADYSADPFAVEINGKPHIYYEELQFYKGKGKLKMLDGLDFKNKKKVSGIVTDALHISYPYLFSAEQELYCIPETAAARQIDLYKIDKQAPENLKKVRTILQGNAFVDSSIIYFENRYWLFTSISGKKDELYIYFSDTLNSEFKAHPLNPIIVEPKISRSAGSLFIAGNKLYRPSQNPEICYGGSIVITEITQLTDQAFQYHSLFELLPQQPYNQGLHTINFAGGLLIVDGKRKVFSLLSPLKKWLKKTRCK